MYDEEERDGHLVSLSEVLAYVPYALIALIMVFALLIPKSFRENDNPCNQLTEKYEQAVIIGDAQTADQYIQQMLQSDCPFPPERR